jgi:hypothetical protein
VLDVKIKFLSQKMPAWIAENSQPSRSRPRLSPTSLQEEKHTQNHSLSPCRRRRRCMMLRGMSLEDHWPLSSSTATQGLSQEGPSEHQRSMIDPANTSGRQRTPEASRIL